MLIINSPVSFSSVANANPFKDKPFPLSPSVPPPLSIGGRFRANATPIPSLPQSQSESSLYTCSARLSQPAELPAPFRLNQSPSKSPDNESRSSHREDGPVPRRSKSLRDNTDADRKEQSRSPSKRAKSPVKRLFGFGKSDSDRNIAGETVMQPKHSRNHSVPETGGRSWTNKCDTGFW